MLEQQLDPNWQQRSKCRGLPPSESDTLFYVGRGKKTTAAKQFCADCPVEKECLLFALVNNQEGIWAGTSDKERKEMRCFLTSLEASCLRCELDIEQFIDHSEPLDPIQTIKDAGDVSASIFELEGPTDADLLYMEVTDPVLS